MGMRSLRHVGMVGICTFALFLLAPTFAQAADEPSVEAAEVIPPETPELSVEHLRAGISAEADPELRAAMEEQLEMLESGQLDMQTLEREMAGGSSTGTRQGETGGTGFTESLRGVDDGSVLLPEMIGIGRGGIGGPAGGSSLPPEAQAELEKIFSQGTGDPSKDGALREQAEKVFEKYGIDQPGRIDGDHDVEGRQMTSPQEAFQQWERSEQGQNTDPATREQYREMSEQYQAEFERGGGLEQRGEGFERAMTEHMAPEAREQMERFMTERETSGHEMSHEGMEREMMEREFGSSSPERSYEAPTHEYEAPTHEYEAPTHEYEAPEAPTHEYEAPEAPTHEYEAPTQEYEAPTHEYEAPMGPGDGSGTPTY
ncbi:MAG TPA: hypothetical protein DDX89_04755 [Candidatus Omnitrophica bacterium]|nr:MAG: hypothetical protein A2Z92_03250 [Omnitrophica WOR_2 bacterium GWA2_63_20]OGX17964.1 MAG: hypothetical protein A2105_04035 [Omnitrophica WOR_2 bacterium GWF2_63_9]OGX31450.1 MAG: hypothetical protein A3E56_00005 [Omnitrophica WOR_2 bacterium RIFCSPHIGHO2_12_FULL_64_13]OGX36374.1 MAG: hypothetical protein A3B73_00950 [Omnitrophica WOR_2 bacterium RIFCSPHIGHO2_02_FULL_63_39]OGX50126.1 MAG: hypothetical protein A3G88_02510 [Omnitrophica WOR_2 bacterium RIFCSPLOWO2_12_FULL_63_16]HBH97086.1